MAYKRSRQLRRPGLGLLPAPSGDGGNPAGSRQDGAAILPLVPVLSTSDVPPFKASFGVLGFAALFIASAAGATFFWVGDLSEPIEPKYADYLWRPWPFLTEHETAVGVVSVIVFLVAGAALVAARRAGRMPAPLLAQVVVLTLFAAWLGLGYRTITAGVIGANIGGGGVFLVTPVFALVTVVLIVGLRIRASRRSKRISDPDR